MAGKLIVFKKTGKTPCKHVLNDVSQSLNHDSFHIMIQSNYVPTTVVEDSQLNEIISWGKYKCLSFGMISSTKIWSCEQGDHQGYIRLTPLLFHFGEVDLLSRTTSNKQQKRFITSNFQITYSSLRQKMILHFFCLTFLLPHVVLLRLPKYQVFQGKKLTMATLPSPRCHTAQLAPVLGGEIFHSER